MKISVELTLLPLQEDFETPIKDFIRKLRKSKFKVLENPMNTQIYGQADALLPFLNAAVEEAFEESDHILITMKIVKGDRSTYEPDF
jgi:uncharacterized protein YqgV (UPF0045/DUF77 family)